LTPLFFSDVNVDIARATMFVGCFLLGRRPRTRGAVGRLGR
jgi:hypothetical protein